MLTGGHPNSLGRTLEVVELVLKNTKKLAELYSCYSSKDEVVRLRVSNCFKRITRTHKKLVVPYIDKFHSEISKINQPSTMWTLATLFDELKSEMSPAQIALSKKIMKKNLQNSTDWIVLNTTMQVLFDWARDDGRLRSWLKPHLQKFTKETRKSVANRAVKLLKEYK